MKRVLVTGMLVLFVAAAVPMDFSAQASKLVSATLTFDCTGVAVTSPNPSNPCTNGDAIAGDNLGPYVGGPTGGGNTAQGAYIDSSGDLYFVEPQQFGRAVFFDFGSLIPGDLRTFTSVWSFRILASQCGAYDSANHTVPLANVGIGQTANGWCNLNFSDTANVSDPYRWTIRFDPVHYPSTNYVRVTRTGQAAWTIQADAPAATAELIASTTSGKYATYDEGFYEMPFGMTVTQP